MKPFDLEEGLTPTVITHTHELPSGYPTALTEVALSSGTGNPACNPPATTINRGQDERTFKLYGAAFRTPTICLSDIKRAHAAARAAADAERGLSEYLTVWWSDFYRVQTLRQIDLKVSTVSNTAVEQVVSTSGDFAGLSTLPGAELNWDHLEQLYFDLIRRGAADELSVGSSSGRPVFPLLISPYYKAKLFKRDLYEEVKYTDSARELLEVLGVGGAVNGFVPIVDVFPIRIGANPAISTTAELTESNFIYPTRNTNATYGRKYENNPDYLPSASGGKAQFEVAVILPREVFEINYEPVDPTSFAGMDFSPTNYIGEFQWVNNKTFEGDNDRGNLGYYLADVRAGSKPVWPDLGKAILTKVGAF